MNPLSNDFVIIITSCQKFKNKEGDIHKRFQPFGVPYYILYGNPELNYGFPNYKKKWWELNNHSLEMEVCDAYESLPFKICSGLKFVQEKHPNSFVLKTDEDVEILDFNTIFQYLQAIKQNNMNYVGNYIKTDVVQTDYHFGKCKSKKWNTTRYHGKLIGGWCCGGFYTLSPFARDTVLKYYDDPKNKKDILKEIYEDKFIGDILFRNKIEAISIPIKKYVKWD